MFFCNLFVSFWGGGKGLYCSTFTDNCLDVDFNEVTWNVISKQPMLSDLAAPHTQVVFSMAEKTETALIVIV